MIEIAVLALGYLLGSIPFGILLARVFGLGDLRKVGSGNIGATNVLRTGNKLAAVLTLLFDALKGTAAALCGWLIGGDVAFAALGALGAFLGHCYPMWLGFRGGKGVATYLGALLGIDWRLFVMFAFIWLAVAFWKRFSSLAALTASALAMLASLFVSGSLTVSLCLTAMTALLYWRHRENIARLRSGTESQISLGSKG